MTERRGRPDANNCFVCGPGNPIGLQIEFRLDGDVCRARFEPGENHVGYQGQVHGGILYSMLDDVMANWLFLRGERGHTARCEVRYRQPVELGTTLVLEGIQLKRKGRLALMSGKAIRENDGVTVADAEGRFMVVGEIDSADYG